MRRNPKRRKLKKVAITLTKVVFLVVVIFGIKRGYNYLFTISDTTCTTSNLDRPCRQRVLGELSLLKGHSLLFTNFKELESTLQNISLEYVNAELSPTLPGKVALHLTLADKLAQVATGTESALLEIYDNYSINSETYERDFSLPYLLIQSAPDLKVGMIVGDARVRKSLELAQLLESHYLPFKEVFVATDSADVLLPTNQVVKFDVLQRPIQLQLTALQIIQKNPLDPLPTIIDVRFEKPVLHYDEDHWL